MTSLAAHLEPGNGQKRILSLDGGGVKGLLTLGILKRLETQLRARSGQPDLVLSDYYDLIGGTSTGAIVSVGLALGKSVDEMIDLYKSMIPNIFGVKIDANGLWRAKFPADRLRSELQKVLGNRRLGTRDLKTGFALFAKRIDTASVWMLSNNPNARYYDIRNADTDQYVPNRRYLLADAVRASAAAPTYFDEVKIDIAYADDDNDRLKIAESGYFVDGAVTGLNNPALALFQMATLNEYGFGWASGADRLMLTSVGTGMRRPRVDGKKFAKLMAAMRGVEALRSMIHDTVNQSILTMQAISDPKTPWIVDSEARGLEKSLIGARALLDYQRLDARLETARDDAADPALRAQMAYVGDLIGRELPPKALDTLNQLDNGKPDNLELLVEIGLAAGARFVDAAYPNPAFDLPGWKA